MHRNIIAGLIVASIAVAPVGAQTYLDKLIRKVTQPKAGTTPSAAPGAGAASMSSTQTAALDRLLATPLQDVKVGAARAEAAPLIRDVLVTAACAKTAKAWNALNGRHLTPQTYRSPGFYDGRAAMTHMKYHDAATCLDVTRLGEWSKPADNVLAFRAWLVATDSGEANNQPFTLQKTIEGEWLIRQVGRVS